MITKVVCFFVWILPLAVGAFGTMAENDQTYTAPGGRYGIYQTIYYSTRFPTDASTWVCSGGTGVHVDTIKQPIFNPGMTGLRQLWALTNYTTNALPAAWLPAKVAAARPDVSSFYELMPGDEGYLISKFIERFGLPSRYLVGRWENAWVCRNPELATVDDPHSLQGPDFLIYDLSSGQAAVLYVPKPPANVFISGLIINSKGELMLPGPEVMVAEPQKRRGFSRRITAYPGGVVTAIDADGVRESIGTWTNRDRQLFITTIKRNADEFGNGEVVWFEGVQYAVDILVNANEVICDPMGGRREMPGERK